ncbi:MAG: ABC transporter ATP-binding protein [Candidatus Sungbacteria bacterium]|nr:ABC transporter ATP-binding protein [Candidatus Sungbacteria bacterium]
MIEIRNVRKSYEGNPVVDDLSLTVKTGSVFGFLGPNGAGKTTTIKMLVGLVRADGGTIKIDGHEPHDTPSREQIGFMPEDPYFYDRLTGMEFLMFCGQLFKKSYRKTENEYGEILKLVGIYDAANHAIATYSKGMKQRLGFAQAIVNDPAHVFLDEPLDGLDPIGRREIKGIIKKLHGDGKTIFFNSHVLGDVEEICHEIGIIHRGKLVYAGDVKQFCNGRTLEEQFVTAIEQERNSSMLTL